MAYSELVKNFDRTRGYMRQFFVFGFKKAARTSGPQVRGVMMMSGGRKKLYVNLQTGVMPWKDSCCFFHILKRKPEKQVMINTRLHFSVIKTMKAR